jgi:hypothetical protein
MVDNRVEVELGLAGSITLPKTRSPRLDLRKPLRSRASRAGSIAFVPVLAQRLADPAGDLLGRSALRRVDDEDVSCHVAPPSIRCLDSTGAPPPWHRYRAGDRPGKSH